MVVDDADTVSEKKCLNVHIGHRSNKKKLVENRETVFLTSVGNWSQTVLAAGRSRARTFELF